MIRMAVVPLVIAPASSIRYSFSLLPVLRPARSTLFPYTTLFRSGRRVGEQRRAARPDERRGRARRGETARRGRRSEEHTSELQSLTNIVCRLLLEKKKSYRRLAGASSILVVKTQHTRTTNK